VNVLVLGGTVFLGRHLVERALARGHAVTMFNRGRSGPDLFPEVERLTGDRDGGLDALRGRRWEAAVDCSGFVPRVVRQSAELLRDAVGVYAFVSSGSVYPLDARDRSEEGPVIRLEDPTTEDVPAAYGGLKALCEDVVREVFGERGLNVRSGLIVGPHDPTERFTYWVLRMARDGEVLAPGAPDRPVQFIDARDEADWILDMAESGRGGTFNVTGPASPIAIGEVLARCGEARPTWVDDELLVEHGVRPYMELPLWVPLSVGRLNMPIDRALTAGLRFRDLDDTIRDTRAWALGRGEDFEPQVDAGGRVRMRAGLTPDREAELLSLWHLREGAGPA
jgi:2'-hydroxyisoflavone reductase